MGGVSTGSRGQVSFCYSRVSCIVMAKSKTCQQNRRVTVKALLYASMPINIMAILNHVKRIVWLMMYARKRRLTLRKYSGGSWTAISHEFVIINGGITASTW